MYFLAYQELFSLIPATKSEASTVVSESERLVAAKDLERVVTGEIYFLHFANKEQNI